MTEVYKNVDEILENGNRHYDQGENPPLTDSEKKQIREHTSKINNGSGKPRCNICAHVVEIPAGTCGVCSHCGNQIGGC